MTLASYTVSDERKRLSGQLWPRGTRTGLSAAGAFLFGVPFLGFGIFIALVGLKIVHVNPRSVHAPYSILFIAGSVFYLAGLWVWIMGYKQYKENCRRRAVIAEHPNNPALADYAWDTKGFTVPRWGLVLRQFTLSAAITLFLSMFNWWAWFAKGGLFVQAIVSLFDILLVALWVYTFILLGRAIKFGKSRVEFTQFPFYTGEKVVLRWLTPAGIGRVDGGTVTLRCVEQWYEISGSGKNESKQLVQEVQWSAQWSLPAPEDIQPGKVIELRFDIPANALATDMGADKPVFWELAIELKEHGLDFKQTHLVPIYRRAVTRAAGTTTLA